MAFTIGQMASISYPAVLADQRKAENQWAESSFMRALEEGGFIEKKSFGPTIEAPLDVKRNPGTAILATDLQQTSTAKTEVFTSASFSPAQVSVPIVWSKMDEVQNPTENQKVALVKGLLTNALESHDDILEQYLFATSTNGFLGLLTHIPTPGQGSDGGIDSAVETMWRNQQATYVDDTDIEVSWTTVWNSCTKGSGSKLSPSLIVSDSGTNALFEGTQQAFQRYAGQEFKAGATKLMFKTAKTVFSPYGLTTAFFLNPKSFKLVVSKDYFRDLSEQTEFTDANGYSKKLYSAVQTITNNKSRLGCAHL